MYIAHSKLLITALRSFLSSRYPYVEADAIDDAVQDAILLFLTTSPQHVREAFELARAWTFTVASRILAASLRRQRRFARLPDDEMIGSWEMGGLCVEFENQLCDALTFEQLVELLPAKDREYITLRRNGYSFEDIASELGCSKHSAEVRAARATKKMKKIANDV